MRIVCHATAIVTRRESSTGKFAVYQNESAELRLIRAHPALLRSVKLNLRTRELDCWDYHSSDNPPILHRKETFLPAGHPLREKFARLTRQEEQHGLLDETATIGTRNG